MLKKLAMESHGDESGNAPMLDDRIIIQGCPRSEESARDRKSTSFTTRIWALLGFRFWRSPRRSKGAIDQMEPLLQGEIPHHADVETSLFFDDDFVFVNGTQPGLHVNQTSSPTTVPPQSPWASLVRIIKLARTQRSYIYIGCLVLVVRLPFSLSIPNFVSASLAALARADYDNVQSNIILLMLYGTIDSVLNFCCGALFGLANLNIVKSLRDDTFEAILGQDIVFFRDNDCGDLASRLSSDCGAIVGDLSGFFRDS